MFRYLIILREDSTVPESAIEQNFEHTYQLAPRTWAVASKDLTVWDVCKRIGVGEATEDSPTPAGIVLKIDEINGWTAMSLWQTLKAWAEL